MLLKTGALALTTMALSFLVAASIALAQTPTASPTAAPTASTTPAMSTMPAAAPATGAAE